MVASSFPRLLLLLFFCFLNTHPQYYLRKIFRRAKNYWGFGRLDTNHGKVEMAGRVLGGAGNTTINTWPLEIYYFPPPSALQSGLTVIMAQHYANLQRKMV